MYVRPFEESRANEILNMYNAPGTLSKALLANLTIADKAST